MLSPDDRPGPVLDRVVSFLQAGVRLIWFVDPDDETLIGYRTGEPPRAYRPPDVVTATPVLSGFRLDLGDLFGKLSAHVEGRSGD